MKRVKKVIKHIMGFPMIFEYWTGGLPSEPHDEKMSEGMVVQGRYYATKMKILISNDLPKDRKEMVVYHEIVHFLDDMIRIKDNGKCLTESEVDRVSLIVRNIIEGER